MILNDVHFLEVVSGAPRRRSNAQPQGCPEWQRAWHCYRPDRLPLPEWLLFPENIFGLLPASVRLLLFALEGIVPDRPRR